MSTERNKLIASLVDQVRQAIDYWNLENGDTAESVGLGENTVTLSNGKEVFMVNLQGAIDFQGHEILYSMLSDNDILAITDAVNMEFDLF